MIDFVPRKVHWQRWLLQIAGGLFLLCALGIGGFVWWEWAWFSRTFTYPQGRLGNQGIRAKDHDEPFATSASVI